jgi:hypothetical protein
MPESYGTSGGVEITDAVVERLADRAERGLDHARLRPRRKPAKDPAEPAATEIRLPSDLSDALAERAARDHTDPSEIIRKALREYLKV